MKKFLIFALVITILTLTVSAADVPAPTVEEVEKLITDSYEMFLNVYGWRAGDEFIDVVLCYDTGDTLSSTAATRKESADYSYWLEKSKALYTDDIAEDMLFILNTAIKYDDKFYVVIAPRIDQSFSVLEGSGALSSVDVNIPGFDGDLEITFDKVSDYEVVANFTYRVIYYYPGDEVDLRTSVNLKYENDKWQISGGKYINLMKDNALISVEKIKVNHAPQTGIDTFAYAAVAVVALAAVAVVVKKRRFVYR